MNYVAVFLLSQIVLVLGGNFCPSCDQVQCFTSLMQSSCPRMHILSSGKGLCGCCPGCATGIDVNVYGCKINDCAPGLKCESFYCRVDPKKCSHLMYIKNVYNWVPQCNDQDETYKAVQCKGDHATGRCFCFSEDGERIFGWDWWRNMDKMSCKCSRKRHKKETIGELSTLHCSQNGDFEVLQCENDICWCAEPKTGEQQLGTSAVPYALWTLLPCYNKTIMGMSYLRQCESMANAQEVVKRKYILHGTKSISIRDIMCDYDGTYGSYTVSGGIASCRWRDGTHIQSYQVQADQSLGINCYCARDLKIFEENELNLKLICSNNGNYNSVQEINFKLFCVDQDGFAVSDLLPITPLPDCDQYFYNKYKSSV